MGLLGGGAAAIHRRPLKNSLPILAKARRITQAKSLGGMEGWAVPVTGATGDGLLESGCWVSAGLICAVSKGKTGALRGDGDGPGVETSRRRL